MSPATPPSVEQINNPISTVIFGWFLLVGFTLTFYLAVRDKEERFELISTSALLVLASLILEWSIHLVGPGEPIKTWSEHISTALITAAALEFTFQAITTKHMKKQHEGSIERLTNVYGAASSSLETKWHDAFTGFLSGDCARLDQVFTTDASRQTLLHEAIQLTTDPYRANLILQHLLLPYLNENRRFREGYTYRVNVGALHRKPPETQEHYRSLISAARGMQFHPASFDILKETIAYRSAQRITNSDNNIEVHIAFTREQLQESFQSSNVFFRELMQVDESLRLAIRDQLLNGDLKRFVREFFAFSARDEYGALDWEPEWEPEKIVGGRDFLKLSVFPAPGREINWCEIQITMLQDRWKPFFLMQINEPCHNPNLSVVHDDDEMEIIDYHFFAITPKREAIHMNNRDRGWLYSFPNQWVFPRAGVLFTWKESVGSRQKLVEPV